MMSGEVLKQSDTKHFPIEQNFKKSSVNVPQRTLYVESRFRKQTVSRSKLGIWIMIQTISYSLTKVASHPKIAKWSYSLYDWAEKTDQNETKMMMMKMMICTVTYTHINYTHQPVFSIINGINSISTEWYTHVNNGNDFLREKEYNK